MSNIVRNSIAAALAAVSVSGYAAAQPARSLPAAQAVKTVVLVHGAFADGSGWRAVADILTRDGYSVAIVQQPMTSLADDVAATRRVLDRQPGPAVLVGHSYGGVIITEAGAHPKVASLVYVAGFAPDQGESIVSLNATRPPAANSIAPTPDGFLFVDPARFPADFAADLPPAEAKFMAISQAPAAAQALGAVVAAPAWKTKPSYGIVATDDRMIAPELERSMYVRAKAKIVDVKGSHAVFASQPRAVAQVIEEAARAGK